MTRTTATALSALMVLSLSATAATAAPPAQAAADEATPGRADVLARLVACRTMADTAARLSCYDVAAAALDAAERQGDAARLSVLPAGHPLGYQDAFTAFVADTAQSIREGVAVDALPGFADGLRAAQLTEAVLDSAARESWVDLPALT